MALNSGIDKDILDRGHAVYAQHCTSCHQTVPKVPPAQKPWHPDSIGNKLYFGLSAQQKFVVIEYLRGVSMRTYSLKVDLKVSEQPSAE